MTRSTPIHLTEEQMVEGYYSGLPADAVVHLRTCHECAELHRSVLETLEYVSSYAVPERGVGYGSEVWARVAGQLAVGPRAAAFPRYWWAVAAGVTVGILSIAVWRNLEPARSTPVSLRTSTAARLSATARKPSAPTLASSVDNVRPVRRVAARPLRHRGEDSAVSTDTDRQLLSLNTRLTSNDRTTLPKIVNLAETAPSERTRSHALFVLAQSDSVEAHEALLKLAQQTTDATLQTSAVRVLSAVGNQQDRSRIRGLYQTSSNPALKREILNGLMLSGSRAELQTVMASEPDLSLRHSAAADLLITLSSGNLEHPLPHKNEILTSVFLADDQSILHTLQAQPDVLVRVATIRSLAALGEQSQVLTSIYRSDSDARVRRAVLDTLTAQRNSTALAELVQTEQNEDRLSEILTRLAMIVAQTPERTR